MEISLGVWNFPPFPISPRTKYLPIITTEHDATTQPETIINLQEIETKCRDQNANQMQNQNEMRPIETGRITTLAPLFIQMALMHKQIFFP
ncbi:hypothetical protein CDAR_227041 [Caerostris darwini]|uniref:Uncharacterized protein n=1 Tax=Caerostris darwini TaxID=1538125 RepID=A0AAV4WJ60_9ARAC|nr:hypothetical protein CDAR_227041 [Caerostris darwini]